MNYSYGLLSNTYHLFTGKPSKIKSNYFSIGSIKIGKFLTAGGRNKIYSGLLTLKNGDIISISIRIPIKLNDKNAIEEIKILESIGDHDNIIKYYGWSVVGDKFAIIQELADRDLFELLNDPFPISNDEKLEISKNVISAIKHLHEKGITYGDSKLENTLITFDRKYKICDIDPHGYTYHYAPLEVHFNKITSFKSDIWTYGIFLWILWNEDIPFSGKDIFSILEKNTPIESKKEDIPSNVINIINSCLSYKIEERPDASSILLLFN